MSLNPVPLSRRPTLRYFYRRGYRSLTQVWRPVRNRIPLLAPYRKAEVHVVREGALGDVLMATPALRRVKELNPKCRIFFYTHFTDLVRGLPFIDEVRPVDQAPTGRCIFLRYEKLVPVRRHIAEIFGDILGIDVRDHWPSCIVDLSLRDHYVHDWRDRPRPWIALNRLAGPWTPNKTWPEPHWEELISRLGRWSSVIETGTEIPRAQSRDPQRYLDLLGQLSLGKLSAVLAAADLHVGPISGPVHLAAALRTPAVVIYGGYEEPFCSSYPGNINLYSPVACAPCWLTELCPYGHPCLHQITPQQVDDALRQLWDRKKQETRPASVADGGS
jgi:ADP-heptose:LPS heptosyltransferase